MECNKAISVYEESHQLLIKYGDMPPEQRNILIKISKMFQQNLVIKLSEMDNYCFNYTCHIDYMYFKLMKMEQELDINFNELESQIIDLLKDVHQQQMFLRLEASDTQCKMIFYEKSRLKSLTFLTIDLNVTDQMEIIQEMSKNVENLKELNKSLSFQLVAMRGQLSDRETNLQHSVARNALIEKQVKKDLEALENGFIATIMKLEQQIVEKLIKMNRKHLKLVNDIEIIKAENKLKCESSVRLVNSLHSLRIENERNNKLIDELQMEIKHLNLLKNNVEEANMNNRQLVATKDMEKANLEKKLDELNKNIQDAELIIAQKSKTHDEIAKDLVQANTMIVNFNNQCDILSQQLNESRELITRKEKVIKEQGTQIIKISEEYARYKEEFNIEEANKLKQELHQARKSISELEKQNQEAATLNGLLTRKLSGSDLAYANLRSPSVLQSSQRFK